MFDKVRKNFGFDCMRLPMQGKEVDYAEFNKMIDAFLDNGLTISSRRTGTSTVTRFACAAATNAFGKNRRGNRRPRRSLCGFTRKNKDYETMIGIRDATFADSGRISEIYDYYVKNAAITFGYVTCAPDEFMERMLNPATI